MRTINGLLERIVQRRRASASSRLGPAVGNGSPPQPVAIGTALPPPAGPAGTEPADPAGTEPPEPGTEPAEPTLAERGRIRRRARYLRRLRELQLRDLGGFVLELHRFGREQPDLVQAKLTGAAQTDGELRALERVLKERRTLREVREPGIGGTCAACGTVHGSRDRFCSWCGRQL